jgi:hypothetical protein
MLSVQIVIKVIEGRLAEVIQISGGVSKRMSGGRHTSISIDLISNRQGFAAELRRLRIFSVIAFRAFSIDSESGPGSVAPAA